MRILLSFVLIAFVAASFAEAAVKVTLDPGHGGGDSGAVYDGVLESHIVFAVAEKLAQKLESKNQIKVSFTRTKDTRMSLNDRVRSAASNGAQLFISLHANAAPESWAKGFEVFVYPPTSHVFQKRTKGLSESEDAVKAILSDLGQQTRFFQSLKASEEFSDRFAGNIKPGDFHVLRQNKIPAILVEIGFLSNPRERQRLVKDEFQNEMAQKMAEAVDSAIEKLGLQSQSQSPIL